MDDATSEKSRRKQRSMWSIESEELLLVLWKQNIKNLRANPRHFYIISKMASKMTQMGYPHTAYETKLKIHNITSRYREERKKIADSGLPSLWPLYDSVHKILGEYHDRQESNDQEESNDQQESNDQHEIEEETNHTEEDYSLNHNENSQDETYEEYPNDEYPNDEDTYDNVEEAATTTIEYGDTKRKERKYLRSINRNLEIILEKLNEVSEHSQSMEKERNATLQKLLRLFKHNTSAVRNSNHTGGNAAKRIKLSKTEVSLNLDHQYESYSESIEEDDPLGNEMDINANEESGQHAHENTDESPAKKSSILLPNKTVIDMKLKEEYLKTKQQEREFMTEKHNLQMQILKMELDAKRKLIAKT